MCIKHGIVPIYALYYAIFVNPSHFATPYKIRVLASYFMKNLSPTIAMFCLIRSNKEECIEFFKGLSWMGNKHGHKSILGSIKKKSDLVG